MENFKFAFIIAKNEIELPDYVEILDIVYPESENMQDCDGTAPGYHVKVAKKDSQRLDDWVESQPKELELDILW